MERAEANSRGKGQKKAVSESAKRSYNAIEPKHSTYLTKFFDVP